MGKWSIVAVALIGLACIFSGGFGVGWGMRAASDAKAVASAQGNFDTCKTTNSTQADVLTKIRAQLKDEETKADQLKSEAAALLKGRAPGFAAIDARAKQDVDAIRKQGHEDPDSAGLARLAVPPAVARRLWPGTAASAGAPASH